MRRKEVWVFVDETNNRGARRASGTFVGLSAVVVGRLGRAEIAQCLRACRRRAEWLGMPVNEVFHAVDFVHQDRRCAETPLNQRIGLLEHLLRSAARCQGMSVLNILADEGVPRPPRTDLRMLAFETLIREVDRRHRGQFVNLIVDRNEQAPVRALYRRLRREGLLPNAPDLPQWAQVRDHPELEVADVCAYMTLQSVSPCTRIEEYEAQALINLIGDRCHSRDSNDERIVVISV